MTFLTSELITKAYYTSGIVSRAIEQPTANQITDGLLLLNELIADRTIDESTIPYTEKLSITAVPGQTEYFIENLIDLDVFTFYIGDVRYQTRNQQRQDYFGSFRPMNIQSLPWNWHVERTLNGANLFLYFVPNVAYPLELWGSFRLVSVTMFQDLSLSLDQFYINFFVYLLAQRLCEFNSYKTPQNVLLQLDKYDKWISNTTNIVDLKTQKLSSLGSQSTINWGWVNLGGGWFPVQD